MGPLTHATAANHPAGLRRTLSAPRARRSTFDSRTAVKTRTDLAEQADITLAAVELTSTAQTLLHAFDR